MVYNVLNRMKWTGKLGGCEVVILHRGAPRDRKVIAGTSITEVKKSYFSYSNERETTIPMHRILEVRHQGKVIWSRSKQS